VRGNIDLEKKEANVRLTPEAVAKGLRAAINFFKNPKKMEKVEDCKQKWEDWLKKEEEMKKEDKREDTVKSNIVLGDLTNSLFEILNSEDEEEEE
jgi:hypothetical protein